MPDHNHQDIVETVNFLAARGFPPVKIRQGLLKLVGETQKDIADELGVARQTVNLHIAAQRRNPEVIHGICDYLGVPIKFLFPDVVRLLRLMDLGL